MSVEQLRYGVAEAEAEPRKKTKAELLVEAAKKVIQRLQASRPEADPKHKNFSPDVAKTMRKPPTMSEAAEMNAQQLKGTKIDQQPRIVPIEREAGSNYSKDLKAKLENVAESGKSPKAVEIVEAQPPRDARSEQIAAKMLEIDETAPKAERQQKIREVAEEAWRLRVGSGYNNKAADDSREYLWSMYNKYVDFEDLSPAEKSELKRDFAELLRTSKNPPDIVITDQQRDQLGGFYNRAQSVVNESNSRYSDLIATDDETIFQDDPASNLTSKNLEEDSLTLDEEWSEYKKEYKATNGEAPPASELNAYRRLQKEYQNRADEVTRQEPSTYEERRQASFEGREGRIPNNISLTRGEAEDLINDPIGTIDNILQDLESGIREYTQAGFDPETRLGRLRLLANYFLMDEFTAERYEQLDSLEMSDLRDNPTNILGIEGDTDGSLMRQLNEKRASMRKEFEVYGKDRSEFAKKFKEQRGRYVKEFTARFHAIQFFEAKSRAGSFGDERLQGTVGKGMTENDFVELSAVYGGLVEDASDILSRKTLGLLRDGKGKARRLNDIVWNRAIKETIQEMKNRKDINEETYQKYINGWYLQSETGSEVSLLAPLDPSKRKVKSYDEAVTAIVNLAVVQKDMWLEREALEIRGLDPYADSLFGDSLLSKLDGKGVRQDQRYRFKRSALAGIKRQMEFNFQQWDSTAGRYKLDRQHNRNIALLYVHHYDHEVGAEAESQMDLFMHDLKSVSKDDKEDYGIMKNKVKYLFFWNPDKYDYDDEMWDIYIDKMKNGKVNKELLEEFKVRIGIKIADTHGLRGFSALENTWRSDTVNSQLDPLLNTYFGADASKRMYTGRKLNRLASDYANAKLKHHHAHAEEHAFIHGIQEIAHFRPHDFAEIMLENSDPMFLKWYDHEGFGNDSLGKDVNEKLTNLGLIVSSVNRQLFRNVMDVTDINKVKEYIPIDFSLNFLSWTQPQKEAFSKALQTQGLEGQESMVHDSMEKIREFITEEHTLHRFTHVSYEGSMAASGPRHYEDLPMMLLQKPERMKFLSPEDRENLLSFGDLISGSGMSEGSGPFKRTFTDNMNLEKGLMIVAQMPTMSDDDFRKNGSQLYAAVGPTAGSMAGAIAYQEQEYAHSKMRGLKRWIQSFTLPGHDATEYRELSGNQNADIMYPEEAHHFQEEMFELTVNANDEIPALMHTKEAELRISTWDKVLGGDGGPFAKMIKMHYGEKEGAKMYHKFTHYLNDMYPSNVMRDKLVKLTLVGMALTALFLFYQAFSSGVGEAKAEAGGHH